MPGCAGAAPMRQAQAADSIGTAGVGLPGAGSPPPATPSPTPSPVRSSATPTPTPSPDPDANTATDHQRRRARTRARAGAGPGDRHRPRPQWPIDHQHRPGHRPAGRRLSELSRDLRDVRRQLLRGRGPAGRRLPGGVDQEAGDGQRRPGEAGRDRDQESRPTSPSACTTITARGRSSRPPTISAAGAIPTGAITPCTAAPGPSAPCSTTRRSPGRASGTPRSSRGPHRDPGPGGRRTRELVQRAAAARAGQPRPGPAAGRGAVGLQRDGRQDQRRRLDRDQHRHRNAVRAGAAARRRAGRAAGRRRGGSAQRGIPRTAPLPGQAGGAARPGVYTRPKAYLPDGFAR